MHTRHCATGLVVFRRTCSAALLCAVDDDAHTNEGWLLRRAKKQKTFAASEATRALPPASAVRSFDRDICEKPATRLALLVAVTFECRELIAPRDYADALEGTRPLSMT